MHENQPFANLLFFKKCFINIPDVIKMIEDDPATEIDLPGFLEDEQEDTGVMMEEVVVNGQTIEIPSELITNETVFNQFFSVDTWNDLLAEEVKLGLLDLLPSFPRDDIDEKAKTIEMLFGGDNFHFGNPVTRFRCELLAGDHQPEAAAMKEMVRSAQRRDYAEWLDRHQMVMVQELLEGRSRLIEAATGNVVMAPKLDTTVQGAGGQMAARVRRRYLEEVSRIKREVGEEGISSDDEEYEEYEKQDEIIPAKVAKVDEEQMHEEDGEEGTGYEGAGQDLQPCFLSLLQQLFMTSPSLTTTLSQLDSSLASWQSSPIAALNSWYEECPDPQGWRATLHSAVAFLSGAFPDLQPQGFVPLVSMESPQGSYSWAGRGRDTPSLLLSLNSWWLERLATFRLGPTPTTAPAEAGEEGVPPGNTTKWTMRPSTAPERAAYQAQERARYSSPSHHFQWSCPGGYTALVGPVKGAGAGRQAKAHAMLVSDRPAGVTVLTLVRDAVSRLPNGEGLRTDIVELLKDSQYLVTDYDPSGLTTTVSGALDRLQNEPDAAVRFDSNRKIWVYMHRARRVEDFLAASQTGPRQRQKRKIKLDYGPSPGQVQGMESPGRETQQAASSTQPPSLLETALAGAGLATEAGSPQPSPARLVAGGSPGKLAGRTVQKIIVKGTDGKVIPLSAATLQKLIEAGAIRPGTQIATPDFSPELGSGGSIRIVQHPEMGGRGGQE